MIRKAGLFFLTYIILILNGNTYACSMEELTKVQIGADQGIKGICSNNRFPISCQNLGNGELSCDGPGGSYSGYDLDSLIFSACGCSSQEEKAKQRMEDFREKK
jgi:hypothetical protein